MSSSLVARSIVLLALGSSIASRTLPGQTLDEVRLGARLRLELRDTTVRRLTGTLVERSADSLSVRPDGENRVVHLTPARVRRIDVGLERRSNSGRGARLGLLVGALSGVLLGVSCDCDKGIAATFYAGLFGSLGAGVGALVGAVGRHDIWQPVDPARPLVPTGTQIGVTLRF